MAYAQGTSVPIEKSVSEIVTLIKRVGANRIAQYEEPFRLAVQCFLQDRLLRFSVSLPTIETIPTRVGTGPFRTDAKRLELLKQSHRQRARALLLVVKAKLESVESGVESFEEAFLANVVMPDGQTVAEKAVPLISQAYESGETPHLMLTAG